ncbi:Ataxin-7 [Manis pentadactyla]|nr:Ataxin-7 [Manis pentadactyla]
MTWPKHRMVKRKPSCSENCGLEREADEGKVCYMDMDVGLLSTRRLSCRHSALDLLRSVRFLGPRKDVLPAAAVQAALPASPRVHT